MCPGDTPISGAKEHVTSRKDARTINSESSNFIIRQAGPGPMRPVVGGTINSAARYRSEDIRTAHSKRDDRSAEWPICLNPLGLNQSCASGNEKTGNQYGKEISPRHNSLQIGRA